MNGKCCLGALATVLVVLGILAPAGAGAAEDVPVQIRVVTHEGKIVADRDIKTGSTRVPTSSRATCFGGTPTDGSLLVPKATALGALADLSRMEAGLRPLLVTNAFDFGLGLCSVGDHTPTGEEWWALMVNGALSSTGGDTTFLRRGDDVLWFLARSYNEPLWEELVLEAPARLGSRGLIRVRVQTATADGSKRPVAGARIFAAGTLAGTTDERGLFAIRPGRSAGGNLRLVARLAGHIPSNRAVVSLSR